jgi:CYTH domain-containing protein
LRQVRDADDEARAPKYAHIERERRWLVDRARRPPLDGREFVRIEDRYIVGTRLRLRRATVSATGKVVHKLTRKYEAPDPLARPIVTAYLTAEEHALLEQLPAHPVEKRRYALDDGGRVFSLDRFTGALAGLELAEIEWPDDEGLRALAPPLWADREVSGDVRYQGAVLAANGIPGN